MAALGYVLGGNAVGAVQEDDASVAVEEPATAAGSDAPDGPQAGVAHRHDGGAEQVAGTDAFDLELGAVEQDHAVAFEVREIGVDNPESSAPLQEDGVAAPAECESVDHKPRAILKVNEEFLVRIVGRRRAIRFQAEAMLFRKPDPAFWQPHKRQIGEAA